MSNGSHKKLISEDSMESIKSEKESEVKYGEKGDSEDDGNASESDDKDGSFISDMLPQNKNYYANDRRNFDELDESNIDLDDLDNWEGKYQSSEA